MRMRTFLLAILIILAAGAALVLIPGKAAAADCRPGSNACDAAHWAANAPAVGGAKAATTIPMACVRVLTYGRTEVLWIEAGHQDYWKHPAFHTQRASSGYVEDFPLNRGWTVTESCISMAKLANISILTLCNGFEVGSGYHWSLTAAELRQLKARGHLTSYVPFLEIRDREAYPVSTVKSAYTRRYGR